MNMTELFHQHLLSMQIQKELKAEISVKGISMLPTLKTGDIITIQRQKSYGVGNIIVFYYQRTVLVHRIVKKIGNEFCCKGDNAYGCELVSAEKVLGKVISVNTEAVCDWPKELTELSLMAGKAFQENNYDIESVKNTSAYQQYRKMLYLYERCGRDKDVFESK